VITARSRVAHCVRLHSPNGLLAGIGLPTPLDQTPGQFGYTGVEEEFLGVLRSKGLPFTPI
jgi:hypothetical protein